MLVNTQVSSVIQQSKRPDLDPANAAASALYSGALQAAQQSVTVPAAQKELDKAADRIDEAFAKTRVALQASVPEEDKSKSTDSAAMADFKDYMSKTPEQRLRDSILQEMGITEDQLKAMPPAQQVAIGKEIAERLQDKMKLAQADKDNGSSDKADGQQVVDKFLAAL